VLERLLEAAAGKAEAIAKLDQAQAAWKSYRDAQTDALWPSADRASYGSVHPMCVALARTNLTRTRTAELRAMLEKVEGDVCQPGWPG
jgi:uncharacterized protein YecT (DUF1311 family)